MVTTADWDATGGTMERWVRDGATWRRDGESAAVVVGRSGLGWGRGVHGDGAPAGRSGPVKGEGDGRAPAGIFWLRDAYGYDAQPPRPAKVRWSQLGPMWRCVDDPASERYNRVFDATGIEQTWTSAEEMRRADDEYQYVVFVGHNDAPPRPGGGSCIFLHVWAAPGAPTVGCTAMPAETLAALIEWIDPGHTALVALPAVEYQALGAAWGLPPLQH